MDWKQFDRGVFLVNVVGIIYDPKKNKILIGKREEDPYLPQLSWCFPGGRPKYDEELEDSLKREIKRKTGLEVEVEQIIFAKIYPEKREFLTIYYLCKVNKGKEKTGEKFVELKWVKPTELEDYFTTSFHPKLKERLVNLRWQ